MSKIDLGTYGGALAELGYAGQVATLMQADILSGIAEEVIDFGVPVVRGTDKERGVKGVADAAAAALIIGVSVRHMAQAEFPSGQTRYTTGDGVPFMTKGFIIVGVKEAVNPGDNVVYDVTNKVFGSVTTGAASGTRIAVPGLQWDSVGAANGVARLKVQMPVGSVRASA